MKRLTILALLMLVTACNTVEGMGKDISAAGQAIDRSASTTKEKMSK